VKQEGRWFHRQGESYRKQRSVIRNEDDVGGVWATENDQM